MSLLGDIAKVDRETLILKFIEMIFNDDWRLTFHEDIYYLLG